MKKILVVDDEYAIVEALAALLADEGYEVVTAMNGKEGLERAAQTSPDLVLLDVMMPVMDGRAMLRALRLDEHLKRTPVVMMSAAPRPTASGEPALEGFLHKPFGVQPLLDLVARLVG